MPKTKLRLTSAERNEKDKWQNAAPGMTRYSNKFNKPKCVYLTTSAYTIPAYSPY